MSNPPHSGAHRTIPSAGPLAQSLCHLRGLCSRYPLALRKEVRRQGPERSLMPRRETVHVGRQRRTNRYCRATTMLVKRKRTKLTAEA